jgi:hypothetical protein
MKTMIGKIPATMWWYGSCAATGAALLYYSGGQWGYVGAVFFLYVVGSLVMLTEYNNGARMAMARHREAMEEVIGNQQEWAEKHLADSGITLTSPSARNGGKVSRLAS